ncbi:hypothetical protein NDN08_004007 [Rhodosorus marinus]|uniref:Nuclear cap-binding protein subunit 2 n=1 Tax=Rhodosorus marinus TaxID=101924 RepID=A0AAV8UKF7_9RHOD|nr:hypothetical protein NDN08_004007 [Rhodosorus marinus]
MASLYEEFKPSRGGKYVDRRFRGSPEERAAKLAASTTLYVGNLAFYTSEDQLWTAFSRFGEVKRVIMGLDRNLKTPCGFCFVEYYRREDAQNAIWIINGVKVDDRLIRADWDVGFEPGRQYGRGRSGGQVRDDVRSTYDAGRGGYGKAAVEGYGARNGMQLWGPAGEPDAMRDDEGPGRKRGREEEPMVTDAPEDIQKRRIFRRGGNR